MARFQSGWLQKKPRKSGDIWVFCYRRQRPEDGAWVEATPIKVGKVRDYASEEAAWRRVEESVTPAAPPLSAFAKPFLGKWVGTFAFPDRPSCAFAAEFTQHPDAPAKLFAYSRRDCSTSAQALFFEKKLNDSNAREIRPESAVSSGDLAPGPLRFHIDQNIGSGCPMTDLMVTPFGSTALNAEFHEECGKGDVILQRSR